MPSLNLGHFTDSFPPIINGVSTLVAELHAELRAQGQCSNVFVVGPAGRQPDPPGVWRTRGFRLGTSQFYGSVQLDQQSWRAARALDVIHAHDSLAIGRMAAYTSSKTRRPLVFTNHTRHDLYVLNYPRFWQPILRAYAFWTIRLLMRASTITTAPSSDAARWLKALVPDCADKVRVVHNGVRLDRFDATPDGLSRDQFNIDPTATIFITVSRLAPEKNLNLFAEALQRAVRAGANAHWIIIGDGPSRLPLQARLAPIYDHVHFLGFIPHDEIAPYLAMADVCATSSLSETNCISVIEGMACGLPYLGVRADWWEDFTVGNQAGIITPRDAGALAAAIRNLCDDEQLRRRLAANTRPLSRKFDIRAITAQWLELYRELAA